MVRLCPNNEKDSRIVITEKWRIALKIEGCGNIMSKEKHKKIFEQYNPASEVVRCPRGRAPVRKELDFYARAAVNLYGVISRKEFVDIFNRQNSEQTTEEELYILLLPLVLKQGKYGFYKEYIVHYSFNDNFDHVDYLLAEQADKPRYIPEKSEFLKYADEDYEDNNHWWKMLRYMWDIFGLNENTSKGYQEIRSYITYSTGINELGPIMDKYNLIFNSEEQLKKFFDLIMHAKNNTRIWENKGHTPAETFDFYNKQQENTDKTLKVSKNRREIGRNDPCPCGSGKKYKKCCARVDEEKTAQLSSEEAWLFYETWFGLMSFVNDRKNVLKAKIKPEYPNSVSNEKIFKVREVLWEHPELIDEYISTAELPQEKSTILKLWRNKHKKGMFFILEYQREYAVIIGPNEQGEDRLYGIKGISDSVANTLQRNLPAQMETVLLPFKGKIIYDSFMSTMSIEYGAGMKAAFREMYDKALKHGIITSLE